MLGSVMTEHVQKHDEHHDGALLALSDWSDLVEPGAANQKARGIIAPARVLVRVRSEL